MQLIGPQDNKSTPSITPVITEQVPVNVAKQEKKNKNLQMLKNIFQFIVTNFHLVVTSINNIYSKARYSFINERIN